MLDLLTPNLLRGHWHVCAVKVTVDQGGCPCPPDPEHNAVDAGATGATAAELPPEEVLLHLGDDLVLPSQGVRFGCLHGSEKPGFTPDQETAADPDKPGHGNQQQRDHGSSVANDGSVKALSFG